MGFDFCVGSGKGPQLPEKPEIWQRRFFFSGGKGNAFFFSRWFYHASDLGFVDLNCRDLSKPVVVYQDLGAAMENRGT